MNKLKKPTRFLVMSYEYTSNGYFLPDLMIGEKQVMVIEKQTIDATPKDNPITVAETLGTIRARMLRNPDAKGVIILSSDMTTDIAREFIKHPPY